MAHLLRATLVGMFVAVATLGACTLKTDGTGATSGPVGGQGAGGDAGEAGTGGAASEAGTGGVGGEGGAGGGIAGAGLGGSAGGGASGAGASGGGAGGSAGASGTGGLSGAGGTGGAAVCDSKVTGKTNVIECDDYRDCTGSDAPVCPSGGEACEIQCSENQSCFNAKIDCNGSLDCTVRCSGYQACRSAEILCGPGTCRVLCGTGGPLDTTESCSRENDGSGDLTISCSGTTGNCTICGVNEPGVTIVNTQACTANGCSCGEIGSCN
jgi:hypothetical protein